MLQVARLATRQLRDSSELVRQFLIEHLDETGGFHDRDGAPDLYYTVFGLDALAALGAELPAERVAGYLERFGDGEGLDLVHLAALARSHAAIGRGALSAPRRRAMRERVEAFATGDGGYHVIAGGAAGTVYGHFLATGISQDLETEPPPSDRIAAFLDSRRSGDGAWANEPDRPVGSTHATAAAIALLRQIDREPPRGVARWLLERLHPRGGFLAAPGAPVPDLLSTATALHALSGLDAPIDAIREPCLDFIDTLWTRRGSFHAHWAEEVLDVEYTYYGLLALGHLSV